MIMNNIELIKSFDELDWIANKDMYPDWFTNHETGQTIKPLEFDSKLRLREQLEEKFSFLSEFRRECLPFGEYPGCVLLEFLNKHFEKEVTKVFDK